MSMVGYLAALSKAQIAAFQSNPALAADYAETSAADLLDRRREAAFANMPAQVREQYEAAKRGLIAQDVTLAESQTRQAKARPVLEALGPFEPILELGKAWNVLHYLLTGHADASSAPGDALMTGTPLGRDVGYGPARLHDLSATKAFGDFLAPLSVGDLLARMDFARMQERRVYPLSSEMDAANMQSWRDEVAIVFPTMKAYVASAVSKTDGLLVWMS